MHLDLVDLRLFIHIAESPSLTQGARKAFISPAAASARIKSLEENLASRRDEAAKAADIVNEEVLLFSRWLSSLDVQPTIVDLIQRGERIGQEELAKTLKRLGSVDDETRNALEALVGSLVRKFNHDPIMFLKRGSMSQEGNGPRISITRRIFNLDKTGCPYSSEEN